MKNTKEKNELSGEKKLNNNEKKLEKKTKGSRIYKFEIISVKTEKVSGVVKIDFSEEWFKNFKHNFEKGSKILLDFEALNLSSKIYGNTKAQTIELQKKNCKQVIKFYHRCVKAIKFIKRKKYIFDGKFYLKNLENKKNNNDYMLLSLLDIKFNVPFFKKIDAAYYCACDYLDLENSTNNMCDFKDNLCVKHRETGQTKKTGCCPSFCKLTKPCACTEKNLSCKIFMCDYLTNSGYYFSPYFIPALRLHFTFLERFVSFGTLCRTAEKSIKRFRRVRFLTFLALIALLLVIVI